MMPVSSTGLMFNLSVATSSEQAMPPPHPQKIKKKRTVVDPEAKVIALSPHTLMETNIFTCEICDKIFQREQNYKIHLRVHNRPCKKVEKTGNVKKVYVCPVESCEHHHPSRAIVDCTGIKKHFRRKHGEKKWTCNTCLKSYALAVDFNNHKKICGSTPYECDRCGKVCFRKDSFKKHKKECDLESKMAMMPTNPYPENPIFRFPLPETNWFNQTPFYSPYFYQQQLQNLNSIPEPIRDFSLFPPVENYNGGIFNPVNQMPEAEHPSVTSDFGNISTIQTYSSSAGTSFGPSGDEAYVTETSSNHANTDLLPLPEDLDILSLLEMDLETGTTGELNNTGFPSLPASLEQSSVLEQDNVTETAGVPNMTESIEQSSLLEKDYMTAAASDFNSLGFPSFSASLEHSPLIEKDYSSEMTSSSLDMGLPPLPPSLETATLYSREGENMMRFSGNLDEMGFPTFAYN